MEEQAGRDLERGDVLGEEPAQVQGLRLDGARGLLEEQEQFLRTALGGAIG